MVGPREWSPKSEPAEKVFHAEGIWIHSRRSGKEVPREESGNEWYLVTAKAPDGSTYTYEDLLPVLSRYEESGHLQAAIATLLDIEFVKNDPAGYRKIAMEIRGLSREAATRLAEEASGDAVGFDQETLTEAIQNLDRQLRKVPRIKRAIERGWRDLMKRRHP